ncbi:DUF7336 domain-containing protein [Chitinophaga nivalis]|uniref:DUF7336 domain-containing protein n=1 Tax=Chitinophaga nivalis TaxID=2991709 RepID=A0ABT3IU21_9BACT|nr:hypothetical protein [Chitinophaga nivalis]MCW3462847.1 hypothetical protein [Chitinophaga nivalis]MCW3487463.1 hypothetical protein [Chitinophaga nivalis]
MNTVYILWHIYYDESLEGGEDSKLLGVYSSRESAYKRQLISATLPGFSDHPNGFLIVDYQLDKAEWPEGFATIIRGE